MSSTTVGQESDSVSPATPDQEALDQMENKPTMGELDKVRNILFGDQIRIYEERVEKIENKFRKKLDQLGADISNQIKEMEDRSRAQYDEILELLGKESHTRESQKDSIKEDFKELKNSLKEFSKAQQERLETFGKETSETLSAETGRLETGFQERLDSMASQWQEAFERVEKEKLSGEQLAAILTRMAGDLDGKSK